MYAKVLQQIYSEIKATLQNSTLKTTQEKKIGT